MDPMDLNGEAERPASSRTSILFGWLIISLQIVASVISYPFLPDRVPSHWNIFGQIDGYMPKLFNAICFPALSMALWLLFRVLLATGPKFGRANQQAAISFITRVLPALFLLLLAVQLAAIAVALGKAVSILFVATMFLSLLFVYLGNYMGKLRRNAWAGIRTRWTMANDTVWERTHRLGGRLFVVVGVVGIVASFIPQLGLWIVLGGLVVLTVVLYVYSYVVYRRVVD